MLLINYLHSHRKKVHYHHNLPDLDIQSATLHFLPADSSSVHVHQLMSTQQSPVKNILCFKIKFNFRGRHSELCRHCIIEYFIVIEFKHWKNIFNFDKNIWRSYDTTLSVTDYNFNIETLCVVYYCRCLWTFLIKLSTK